MRAQGNQVAAFFFHPLAKADRDLLTLHASRCHDQQACRQHQDRNPEHHGEVQHHVDQTIDLRRPATQVAGGGRPAKDAEPNPHTSRASSCVARA